MCVDYGVAFGNWKDINHRVNGVEEGTEFHRVSQSF